ncbi:porin family protein [Mongoliitalea daihaiensis]|uniref:DUF2490 domain-containing protein n=1 Tax=Mongoliitalea daihaiensis TaxID=2782006 RepID=UPI001F1C7778|nr:DUF2490 domain-containing protein [Mongoliitalea daihaiensis]UJP63812.1 DUF2490 domain-containing protein [Mongoliitalea daihaiensis]
MKVIRTILLILCFQTASYGQRDASFAYETWWGVMTSTQISNKLAIWNDAHFVNDLFFIYRTGLTFHNLSDNLVTTVGYGYLRLGDPFSEGRLKRSEHRPWMQTVYRVPSTRPLSTSFRFRYDARFIQDLGPESLVDEFSFNHRWRFNNAIRYNFGELVSPNTRFATAFLNESLFRTGPGTGGFRYEHRTHLLTQLTKGNFTYSLGYVMRYIPLNAESIRINHGPVFWLSINLNAMKNRKTQTFEEFPSDHIH